MAARTLGPRYYTTKRSSGDFLRDIMGLLSEYGCGSYMVEQESGEPSAVAFQLDGLAYRLRPNVDGIARRLEEDGVAGRSNTAAPKTIAWAQARHLLELQLEAIASGVGKASEILGGYVLTENGRTVGDMIEERHAELMPGERLMLPKGTP